MPSPLFSASYFSHCQTNPVGDAKFTAMVDAASRHNLQQGITGALFYREGCFFQWLEGPEEAVVGLLEKIKRDRRHRRFQMVHTQRGAPRRLFESWGMSGTLVDERLGDGTAFIDTLRELGRAGLSGLEFGKAFLAPTPGAPPALQVAAFSSSQLWLNPLLSHLSAQSGLPRTIRWYRSMSSSNAPLSLEELCVSDDVLGTVNLLTVPKELLDSPLAPLLLDRDALVFLFRRDLPEEELPWIGRVLDLCVLRAPPPVVCCVLPPSVRQLRDGIRQLAEARNTVVHFCGESILMGKELWLSLRASIHGGIDQLRQNPAAASDAELDLNLDLAPGAAASPPPLPHSADDATADADADADAEIDTGAAPAVPTVPAAVLHPGPIATPPIPPPSAASADRPAAITATEQPSALNLEDVKMTDVNTSLDELMQIEGALGVVLADYSSGMVLGMKGGGVNLELAAAGNTEVIRAKMKTMKSLGLDDDHIEDMLITLGKQIHIIRPLVKAQNLFVYIVLDKARANLAMARYKVASIESTLKV